MLREPEVSKGRNKELDLWIQIVGCIESLQTLESLEFAEGAKSDEGKQQRGGLDDANCRMLYNCLIDSFEQVTIIVGRFGCVCCKPFV